MGLNRCAVRIEERQILEIDDVISVCGFSLCENRELAYYISADRLYELLKSLDGISRADYVIHYEDSLSFHNISLVSTEAERLDVVCGNRSDFDLCYILHVELRAFSGYDVWFAGLACHLVAERNALALGCDEYVELRCFGKKLCSYCLCDFNVVEHNEACDIELVCYFAERQMSLEAGYCHLVIHKYFLSSMRNVH